VAEALDCPCVADLKNSSCGAHFVTGASCARACVQDCAHKFAVDARSVHVLRAL
jgi:hypothetical protein